MDAECVEKLLGSEVEGPNQSIHSLPENAPSTSRKRRSPSTPTTKVKEQSVCAVRKFVDYCSTLSAAQREAVLEMGFGGLLSMKIRALHLGLIKWLAEQWDEGNHAFHIGGKMLEFTARDANLILGLSIGGMTVIPHSQEHSTDQLRMQLKLGKGHSVLASDVHKNLVVGGEDVKWRQSFALFALSTVLCPTSMGKMEDVYLHHVLDMQTFRDFDWATHVVDMCKQSFSLYNTRRRKLIGGCTVLVQIWFLEHLQSSVLDLSKMHLSVPLIKNWTPQGCLRLDGMWGKTGNEQTQVQERIYEDVEQICNGPTWEVVHRSDGDHTTISCPTNMNNADADVQCSPRGKGVIRSTPPDVEQLVKENNAQKADLTELRQMLEESQFVIKSLESQIQALERTVQKLEQKEMHGATHGTITDLTVGAEGPELVSANVQGSFPPIRSSGCLQKDTTIPDDADTDIVEPADMAATVRRGSRNIKTSRVLKSPYETTSRRGKQIALRRHTRMSVAASEARAVGK